ncbi:MAG: hypothetical protein A3J28_01580 [Acidobacteria bacterium RIFCSPLOWO2_12_FULL_60_22]|nr:MAG: hypothetical protein A3J28_01580 [Acidobacteria bacterium RIFCSPLOWO2_12_FULL_60_22]
MTTPSRRLPLTIFCGKGGVGKTTLSLAYALRHANQGRTSLVVTSHPLPELAVSVSLAGLKEKLPVAAANLFVIHVDPREILNSEVEQQIPSKLLAEAVLSSRIYQSLVEVAPGLKEIAFLGRLQQLAEERSPDETARKFDLLVWDAPATGHFLQTLNVSKNFDLYLSGPFALLGKQLTEFFSDPSNFALIPVTTLEEMAVEETIELCEKLVGELTMRPRCVICNLTSPLLASPDPEFENLYRQMIPEGTDSNNLKFILDRHAIERSLFQRLRSAIGVELQTVERRPYCETDLDLLLDLSCRLETLSGV